MLWARFATSGVAHDTTDGVDHRRRAAQLNLVTAVFHHDQCARLRQRGQFFLLFVIAICEHNEWKWSERIPCTQSLLTQCDEFLPLAFANVGRSISIVVCEVEPLRPQSHRQERGGQTIERR